MPYIPVTTAADRSFARDADALSGRIDNRGWQASNIFDDNAVAMSTLPYKREMQQMLMDRAQVLEASQRTRGIIARDDMEMSDQNSFQAFNEGLGDVTDEQYNEKVAMALRNDPTNKHLQDARKALDSTVNTREAMGQNAFQSQRRELGSKLTEQESSIFDATQSAAHETALVSAGTALKTAQLKASEMNKVFSGTPDDLHRNIGASGMSPENKMAMSKIVQVLAKDPAKSLDAFNALNSVVAGFSSQRESGRYFQERIKPYAPAIQRIQQALGVNAAGELLSPFDPDPKVQARVKAVITAQPGLAGPLLEVMDLHRDHQANEQAMATLEQELPKSLGQMLEMAKGSATGMSSVDFDEYLGKFKAITNMYAGNVAENMKDYAESYKLRMDESKIEAMDTRLKLAIEAGDVAKARYEVAQLNPDIKERQQFIDMRMGTKKVQMMNKEKWDAHLAETMKMADRMYPKNAPVRPGGGGGYSGDAIP